jgi:death on curing protein
VTILWPHPDDLLAEVLVMCERAGFHVRDPGALSSALARPVTEVFGQEQYPDLLTKAAVLLDSISRSHPLLDGNKRLAWEVSKAICGLNGVRILADPQEIDRFVRTVAGDRHLPIEEIRAWLDAHSHRAPTTDGSESGRGTGAEPEAPRRPPASTVSRGRRAPGGQER